MYNGDDAVDTYDANAEDDDDDDENYNGDYSGDPEKDVYDFADMMMTYVHCAIVHDDGNKYVHDDNDDGNIR